MHASPDPHAPPPDGRPDNIARDRRRALALFAIYVVLYAGFVLLSAFKPAVMGANVAGVNLAIVYGFGLIVAAFLLALVYMVICREGPATKPEDRA
jgi:uncharacterized membrane protein (DUF485 family)